MGDCARKLETLGVSWHLERRGERLFVVFDTGRPDLSGIWPAKGAWPVRDGGVLATLQELARLLSRRPKMRN
jgi:hypothetical protein